MGLSRLDNFLKSVRGTIIYVDPNSLDSTDSIENSGNSLTRPFKTIQRALIESARFSYQRGLNNDRFGKTTILVYPGDHIIDNRPGYIPISSNTYFTRGGEVVSDLTQWDLDTVFDLGSPNNTLYKLNSIHGGVIIPRGTSIVGMDLRKTKIRPTYVPNPENDSIERSAIFRTTGGCYFWQFTILDADPNGTCYLDYTSNVFVPNFSHHKLSGFEYADGVNGVYIDDDFLNGANKVDTTRTDLDMYYEKVAAVYGASSGREIQPDYGDGTVDIQPVIDEYRIVGPKGASVGITSIRSGDGVTSSTTITVDLIDTVQGLSVDSPIQISGVSAVGYDGQHVISSVLNDTRITYKVQNPPVNPLPGFTGASLDLVVDTVTSASPYIFNISLRSVFGMCGLLADGDKATGFKSMVVAQYTGIGLQKDDNAFVRYDTGTGDYRDSTEIVNLHTNSRSVFKPSYQNFHIKATNDAFLQLVSVFAIGYAQHFVAESGGDLAINNSNSNFGAKALVSSGFKRTAFSQDDYGYITHVIPPKEFDPKEITVEFKSIDVGVTTQRSSGAATTSRLYLYQETNQDVPPNSIIDGYSIGATTEDLSIQVFQNGTLTKYSSTVQMPVGPYATSTAVASKSFNVGRSIAGINSITANVLTLVQPHSFINGESIRVIADIDDPNLPDGLEANQIYYASLVGITTNNQIYISKTLNDAINGNPIEINNKGGTLRIVSSVLDKNAGDIGHPIQWDSSGYWYIGVSTSNNGIYNAIRTFGVAGLGNATSRTYVTRQQTFRNAVDTIYRVRYVIPKNSPGTARPPVDGFILQESNNIVGSGATEISQLYNPSASISATSLRNPRFIADASWGSNAVLIRSELPHNLKVGDQVQIVNVLPSAYNGTYTVKSTPSAKEFTYTLTTDPGTFTNDTSVRDENLPYFRRKKYAKTYQIYRTQEIQPYIKNAQDGIYYLTLINHSNYPTVTPFREQGFSQPVENLYPQNNLNIPKSDPDAAISYVLPSPIGKVEINDPRRSITKETVLSFVGAGITDIRSSTASTHTIYTAIDHGLSAATSLGLISGGSGYGSGSSGSIYNAKLVGFAGSTTGSNATVKIDFDGSGTITEVTIIDGGSAYGIGNTLRVVGVATTTGFVESIVRVERVSSNIGDTLQVTGVYGSTDPITEDLTSYNTLYRITGIQTGKTKEINVVSSFNVSDFSVSGLGSVYTSRSSYFPTGKVIGVSTFVYNPVTGLATVGFTTSHGLRVDNKIIISGATPSVFNGSVIVSKLNSLTSLVVNVGIAKTTATTTSGTLTAYRPFINSYGGDLEKDTESFSGRLSYQYAGITTTLRNEYAIDADTSVTTIDIPNAVTLGFKLGDYFLVNNEIFRIRTDVNSNDVYVHRALLGSPRQTHERNSVIRKIKVTPVEIRRNSIIRASGHTFEYLGFGPGNYSTSLPDKQDRALSNTEKFLAQATKIDGGIVVYTGMNSDGDFFAGNKKINSATGKEETFDTPIVKNLGEKEEDTLINITDTQKLSVERSIRVEGGKDGNSVSEFDGPVVFNKKITAYSDIEANSIFLQGQESISRKVSVANSLPTTSGNYGDIVFNSEPSKYEFVGWSYVTENKWEPFGWIGNPGVGVANNGTNVGFATLINYEVSGIALSSFYDSQTGIATLRFNANPKVGISSGLFNTFAGLATQINFVGYGLTVLTSFNETSGIATVTIVGASTDAVGTPGLPGNSIQYNNSGAFGGVPIFSYNNTNNSLVVQGNTSASVFQITQSGSGNLLSLQGNNNVVVSNNGYLGVGSATPTASVDIFSPNQPALYIKSLSGAGNIVRVDDANSDTTPFVIDIDGNVGIKTLTPNGALDVTGTTNLVGDLRLYETDRSNYIGLGITTLSSNLDFKLPSSYGTSGQVLVTNGSGSLSWITPSTPGNIATAGVGITITYVGQTATIANSGVRRVIAGSGVSISPSSGTGEVTITSAPSSPYPFTNKGFAWLL